MNREDPSALPQDDNSPIIHNKYNPGFMRYAVHSHHTPIFLPPQQALQPRRQERASGPVAPFPMLCSALAAAPVSFSVQLFIMHPHLR